MKPTEATMPFITEYIAAHGGRAVLLQAQAQAANGNNGCIKTPLLTFPAVICSVTAGRHLVALRHAPTQLYCGNGDGGLGQSSAEQIQVGVWEASGCRYRPRLRFEPRLDPPNWQSQAMADHHHDMAQAVQAWLEGSAPWLAPDDCARCYGRRLETFIQTLLGRKGVSLAVGAQETVKIAQLRWDASQSNGRPWWPQPSAGIVLVKLDGQITGRVYAPDLTFETEGD